jgi:hypothetical protein
LDLYVADDDCDLQAVIDSRCTIFGRGVSRSGTREVVSVNAADGSRFKVFVVNESPRSQAFTLNIEVR